MAQKDLGEIRRYRLQLLLDEMACKPVDFARRLGKAPAQVSHWLHGQKSISEQSARLIETRARKPLYWLDQSGDTPRVTEPPAGYTEADLWPLQKVRPHQLRALDRAALQLVERHIELLLAGQAQAAKPDAWRDAAIALASRAYLDHGNDQFTKFCLAVDAELHKASAAAAPRKRAARATE